jgi:glucose/mannose-6-phosphate isomerase
MEDIHRLKDRFDSRDMHGMITAMASHLEEGMTIGKNVSLDALEEETFHSIVVAGMGGSAIAGDISRGYLLESIQIPFLVCRHYKLPGFVNKRTLVICSSYSGNTEETLSAYDDAMGRGAKVIALTTGGELGKKARADRVPNVRVKSGLPPRAALGYSFSPLLVIFSRLGLCEPPDDEIKQTVTSMKKWARRYELDAANNPALALARDIYGRIPVIYAGCGRFDAVATRFKGQISENAECLAFANIFPEFNHNELVGWNKLYGLDDKHLVMILRDSGDHARIKARMDIVTEYLQSKGIKTQTIETAPGLDLERIFYLVQLVDFTSYFLALLNEVDPYPVAAIDFLKERLSAID